MASTLPFPLLRALPVPLATLDLNGRILDANPALLAMSGYALDEIRGRAFETFLEPAEAGDAVRHVEAVACGRVEAYRGLRRYRMRSGAMLEVDLGVSLLRGEDGQPGCCIAVLQDVTTYRQAVREAARRAAELEAVIQSIPAAVYIGDETGITMTNRQGLDQLGFESMDQMNQEVAELAAVLHLRSAATGDPLSRAELPFVRALGGERVDVELRMRHARSGAEMLRRVIAGPIVFDGRIVGAATINVDITRQRETEEALRMSEERYRALVEQSPLSIQILSPDGRTIQVNRAWERLWGFGFESLRDYNMLEDAQLVERGVMPYVRRGFAGEPVQIPAALYDPEAALSGRSAHHDPRRWVRAVMYPLKDGRGSVREVVLIHEDITEQIRADEQRRVIEQERERLLAEARRANAQAQAALRVKEEFLAVLSHELRTPLNAVLGWARILRGRATGDQVQHAVTVIERNAQEQARLIDEMLDLSRITTGGIRLYPESVDVARLAAAALESIGPAADARRIRTELRLSDPLPPVVADPQRLQQVFWNLLSNAVKFTEPGGRVTVALRALGDLLQAEVSDTGIGISPEVLPFVFDRFTQGDSSSTRAHAGLGLGLAIVRHLVELHGGSVAASSAGPGQGATFRFTLPLRR